MARAGVALKAERVRAADAERAEQSSEREKEKQLRVKASGPQPCACERRAGQAEQRAGAEQAGRGEEGEGRCRREERSAPGPISRPAGQVEEGKGEKGRAGSWVGLKMRKGTFSNTNPFSTLSFQFQANFKTNSSMFSIYFSSQI